MFIWDSFGSRDFNMSEIQVVVQKLGGHWYPINKYLLGQIFLEKYSAAVDDLEA